VRRPLLLVLVLAVLGFAAPAIAADAMRIAAIVNDEAISQLDLVARVRMAILSSNLEDTPEVRQRLAAQVLRTLIDERLKLQEATKQGVAVSGAEVSERLAQLARQNGLSQADFETVLKKNGIPPEALTDQIKTEIAWLKLAQRKLRPLVRISEEEIDAELARIAATQGKPESLVAEIFLPVESADQDAQVRQNGERLIQQLREGAPFPAIARQFSGSATAAGGGVIGWVRPGQLEDALDKVAQQLGQGEVSNLIPVVGGYQILTVVDRRIAGQVTTEEGRVSLAQLLLPLPQDPSAADIDFVAQKARAATQKTASCDDLAALAKSAGSAGPGQLSDVAIGQLPDALRRVVTNLPVGRVSEPIRLGRVVGVFMVCSRDDAGDSGAPNRLNIADRLARERLDQLARGYLRDLRRQAYIEIRN
jgi:peptidyl-prolyl cis-trans isomerase SurA